MAKQEPTLSDPRCAFQLTKKHYERYTPELVEKVCGVPKDKFLEVARLIGETGVREVRVVEEDVRFGLPHELEDIARRAGKAPAAREGLTTSHA